MRVAASLLAVMSAAAAVACMWDSDTLAMEAKGKLNFVDAITGRFPRNPPLYYQMRLARVEREVTSHPEDLELYDDGGSACDRLGRGVEAIAWMAKKRQILERLKDSGDENKDHWYRYFANLGTFEVHRWFREGAKRERLGEAEQARDHIAKAIEINPDAHFGRERVQLLAMEWSISVVNSNGKGRTLAEVFESGGGPHKNAIQEAEGLAGLIILGNAWESPDIFLALMNRLSWSREASLAELARQRAVELLNSKKASQTPEATAELIGQGQQGLGMMMPMEDEVPTIRSNYAALRKAADEYHLRRTEFMVEKLQRGEHPDTNPDFWSGFAEPARVEISERPWIKRAYNGVALLVGSILLVVLGAFVFAIVVVIRRARWVKRLRH